MFLASIPLAWIAHCRHQARVVYQTIQEIRKLGGKEHYLLETNSDWLKQLLVPKPQISYIDFPAQCSFSDANIQLLKKLENASRA